MTLTEAEEIVKNTRSPYLRKDLLRFIKKERRKNVK